MSILDTGRGPFRGLLAKGHLASLITGRISVLIEEPMASICPGFALSYSCMSAGNSWDCVAFLCGTMCSGWVGAKLNQS